MRSASCSAVQVVGRKSVPMPHPSPGRFELGLAKRPGYPCCPCTRMQPTSRSFCDCWWALESSPLVLVTTNLARLHIVSYILLRRLRVGRCRVLAIASMIGKQSVPESNRPCFGGFVRVSVCLGIECRYLATCYQVHEVGTVLPRLNQAFGKRS